MREIGTETGKGIMTLRGGVERVGSHPLTPGVDLPGHQGPTGISPLGENMTGCRQRGHRESQGRKGFLQNSETKGEVLISALYTVSHFGRKPVFGFPTRSDTNRAVHAQKIARGLKLRTLEVEGLYYVA